MHVEARAESLGIVRDNFMKTMSIAILLVVVLPSIVKAVGIDAQPKEYAEKTVLTPHGLTINFPETWQSVRDDKNDRTIFIGPEKDFVVVVLSEPERENKKGRAHELVQALRPLTRFKSTIASKSSAEWNWQSVFYFAFDTMPNTTMVYEAY